MLGHQIGPLTGASEGKRKRHEAVEGVTMAGEFGKLIGLKRHRSSSIDVDEARKVAMREIEDQHE